MNKLFKLCFFSFLTIFSHYTFAGCSYFAGVAPNVATGPYIAQIIDNVTQNVLAQLGPISHGQQTQTNFACSNNAVYAKFIYTQNSNYNYSSGPMTLVNGQEAACALYADYSVQCKIRPCYKCEDKE